MRKLSTRYAVASGRYAFRSAANLPLPEEFTRPAQSGPPSPYADSDRIRALAEPDSPLAQCGTTDDPMEMYQ